MTIDHVLHTARLTLRALQPGDEEAVFALRSDPEAMRYGSGLPWTDRAVAAKWIAEHAAGFARGEYFNFAIVLNETGAFIGHCGVYALDRQSRRADVGYALLPTQWGKGYAREAVAALLGFAFDTLDLNRLEADIHPDNIASRRLLEKLGFEQDGYMRERWIVGDQVSDSAMFGLLAREWRARLDCTAGR